MLPRFYTRSAAMSIRAVMPRRPIYVSKRHIVQSSALRMHGAYIDTLNEVSNNQHLFWQQLSPHQC